MKNLLKMNIRFKFITILICTRNRGALIEDALKSLKDLYIPKCINYEVIIVDNGSNDNTKNSIFKFIDSIPLKYIYEDRGGHSYGLNTGIDNSKGDLVLMTDDDVEVDKFWLFNYWEIANKFPDAGYYFGKIKPIFEINPPYWWNHLTPRSLSGRDEGEEVKCFDKPLWQSDMIGANIAAPRKILKKYKFNTKLGGSPITGLGGGTDTKLGRDIIKAGYKCYYVPDSIINHIIPRYRINFDYMKKRKVSIGRSSIYFEKQNHIISSFFYELFLCLIFKVRRNDLKFKKSYLALMKNSGKLYELFYFRFKLMRVYESIDNL